MAALAQRMRTSRAVPVNRGAISTSGRICARQQQRSTVVTRDSTTFTLAAEDGDISPGIAAGLFVAVKQGAFQATAENLRYVIAIATLVLPVCNIFFRKEWTNRDTATLAPLALATEALNIASITPAAVAAFGTALCGTISNMINVNGAYYGVLASLAAAVYTGYSAQWIAAALVITYGYQGVTNAQKNNFMVSPLAVGLAAIYALYKAFADNCTSCVSELAACFVIARVGWSAFAVVKKIFEKESD